MVKFQIELIHLVYCAKLEIDIIIIYSIEVENLSTALRNDKIQYTIYFDKTER